MRPFTAKDMDGNDFWIDFDGAEGIGFWVGDPEAGSKRLDFDTTYLLVAWFLENFRFSPERESNDKV